jgi:hypothetical protein
MEGKGYFNVDVKVPNDPALHEFLQDLPPLPERVIISEDSSSEFQKYTSKQNPNLHTAFGSEQYLCTLLDKLNYSVFCPSLLQALDVGLEVIKINGIWEFDQEPFLK